VPNTRLRHPAEIAMFVFMVILNVIIIWAILHAAITLPFLPDRIVEPGWGATVGSAFIALLFLVSHPYTVRRLERLFAPGLLRSSATDDARVGHPVTG
jgi:hypothetical protein